MAAAMEIESLAKSKHSALVSESSEESSDEAPATRPPCYMYLLAFCAALNSTNDGFDIGVGSGVAVHLQDELQLTDWEIGLFFGSLSFTAAVGGLLSHRLSDRFGRRMAFVVAQVVAITGIAVICSSQSFRTLMAGRVLVGIGIGIGFSIDPLYIAEVAPASHRGMLTSWCEVALSLGVTFGFIANYALRNLPRGQNWRAMVAVGAVLPAVLIVLAIFVMPESPRWLVANGRADEALAVLQRTHPHGHDVTGIIGEMDREVERTAGKRRIPWRSLFCPARGHRRAVFVGLGLALGQQLNGHSAVSVYSPRIFRQAGIGKDESSRLLLQIVMGIVKTSCVGISACMLDTKGRRPLLLASTWAVAVAAAAIAVGVSTGPPQLAAAAVLSYGAVFTLGLGPITWVYCAELFPSHLRAKAMGVAVFLNRTANGFVNTTFLPISQALGSQAAYFVLASGVTALLGVCLCFFAPETKQRTLEQLGQEKDPKGMFDFIPDCSAADDDSDTESEADVEDLASRG